MLRKRREGHHSAKTFLPVCFSKENPCPGLSSEMISRYDIITKCYRPLPPSVCCSIDFFFYSDFFFIFIGLQLSFYLSKVTTSRLSPSKTMVTHFLNHYTLSRVRPSVVTVVYSIPSYRREYIIAFYHNCTFYEFRLHFFFPLDLRLTAPIHLISH